MPLLGKRNLVLLFVIKLLVIGLFVSGCQEGTNKSPVSALLTGLDINQATVDLTTLGDDVAKHNIVGTVVSQNTGEKLANITVNLYYESQLAATSKTTSDGQFYFAKVPSGLFDLTFFSADNTYASATYILRVLDNGTTSPANPEVKMSALNPGQIKVQAKIEGEVMLSGTGAKIPNINIELEDAAGALVSTALTGPQGQFSFSNLGTGTYTIKAGKASNYEEGQQPVTIRADGVVSPRYTIVSLKTKAIETFSIVGYVRNQTSEAISNLKVELFEDTELTRPLPPAAYTTGEGKFFFQVNEAKMYFLRANASEITKTASSTAYPIRVLSDGTTSPVTAEILVIRDDTVKTFPVAGKIYDAFTGGPLEYATIKIGNVSTTVTDRMGNYLVNDLLPGTYKFEISKFGYETLSTTFQLIEKNDGTSRTIPTNMSYPLLHDMKTGYGSIAGRYLTINNGEGLPDKFVFLYRWVERTKSYTIFINGNEVERTITDWELGSAVKLTTKTSSIGDEETPDLEGSFKFTHLEPGYYLVYFSETSTFPTNVAEARHGLPPTWTVPNKSLPQYIYEVRGLNVEAGKTTYWTNYEQEYK